MSINYRYEIKYKIDQNQLLLFDSWLMTSMNKITLYEPRWINSIYYDTENFETAEDNLSGFSNRVKISSKVVW